MRKNEEKGRNTGTDTAERNAVELFLEDVEAQIPVSYTHLTLPTKA